LIDVKNQDGQWHVTLNRPDKANALTPEMLVAVANAAQAAHKDPNLRSFVLTGVGTRVFCAGADVGDDAYMYEFTRDPVWSNASNAIADLPCMTIAALNGTLAGGGFALALACDIRITTPHAKFFYPVLKRGFLPQPADIHRMAALTGPAQAKLILLGGQKIDATEALRIRLVDCVMPHEEFAAFLDNLCADAQAAKPQSSAAIKQLFKTNLTANELADCYAAAYFDDPNAILRVTRR
jgi:enoyl-CoA hydratase/carnithine racemase